MGNSLGAARDNGGFRETLNSGKRPKPSGIVYDGVFNESMIRCSVTEELLDCVMHSAIGRDGKPLIGLEIISVLDGKPRGPMPIDMCVLIDTSGSMGSQFGEGGSLLDAAKRMTCKLASSLRQGDRLSVCSFSNEAVVRLGTIDVDESAPGAVKSALADMKTHGGTTVSAGMTLSFQQAASMTRTAEDGSTSSQRRIVVLSDMCDGEIRHSMDDLQAATVEGAKQGIFVTYVGLGQEFDMELTEQITVASGSNYFSVNSQSDFDSRIVQQMHSSFFPTVRRFTVTTNAKQHRITGIFGAGKTGTTEEEDSGYSRDKAKLYGTQVQAIEETGLPSDVVGLLVDAAFEPKPKVLMTEHSCFPSPKSDKDGYQEGGWVILALERAAEGQGIVQVEIDYERNDGSHGRLVREIDVGAFESQEKPGWCSDEGVGHAVALKEYVDQMKAVLADKECHKIPAEFEAWIGEQATKYDLSKQLETIEKLKIAIANEPAKPVE